MKITFQEILKLKGTYLVDKSGQVCLVESVTTKHIRLKTIPGLVSIMTPIFMEKRQQDYEKADEAVVTEFMNQKLEKFIQNHAGEIRGLYDDGFYKNGGWNGTMDALDAVEKRYNFWVDYDHLSDGLLERLIKEYV